MTLKCWKGVLIILRSQKTLKKVVEENVFERILLENKVFGKKDRKYSHQKRPEKKKNYEKKFPKIKDSYKMRVSISRKGFFWNFQNSPFKIVIHILFIRILENLCKKIIFFLKFKI